MRKLLFLLILAVSGFSWAASITTLDNRHFEGEIEAISERGVVIATKKGAVTVMPEEILEMKMDRPWILGFANGEQFIGTIRVKDGKWYVDGKQFNFYSVYAFAPATQQPAAGAVSDEGSSDNGEPTGAAAESSEEIATESSNEGATEPANEADQQGRGQEGERQNPSDDKARAEEAAGKAVSSEGAGGAVAGSEAQQEQSPSEPEEPVQKAEPKDRQATGEGGNDAEALPRAQIELGGGVLQGEILTITPRYLILQDENGSFSKVPTSKIDKFASSVPWTVVDVEGERYTGRLVFDGEVWRVGETPLDLDQVVAFVPRIDLAAKRAPVATGEGEKAKTIASKKEEKEPAAANGETAEGADRSNGGEQEAAGQGEAAAGQNQEESAPAERERKLVCPDPDSLDSKSKINVAGWGEDVALRTGRDFEENGDDEEAVRIYKQVIEYSPEEPKAWLYLGLIYRKLAANCMELGKEEVGRRYYDLATEAFAQGVEHAEKKKDKNLVSYWLARVKQESRWGQEAAEAFEEGYNSFQKGDYDAAAKAFARAGEANPNWPDAFYWQARSLLRLGKEKEAITAFERTLEVDPDFEPAQNALLRLGRVPEGASLKSLLEEAYQREVAGDLEAARNFYLAAVRRFPDAFAAFYRLGLLDRKLGLWAEAKSMLERALELADADDAKMVRYWLGRLDKDAAYGIEAVDNFEKGYAAYTKGDYKAAEERFRAATRLAGGWVDAYYWLARSLIKLGDSEEAGRLLQKVLELDPEHSGAKTLLANLEAGEDTSQTAQQ